MRALILLFAFAAACDYGFEKQSHVSKLRVLAVRADPPVVFAQPGRPIAPVTITALAVGPSGEPVEMEYALCHAIGLPEASLECPGPHGDELPVSGTSATLELGDAPEGMPSDVPLIIGFDARSAGQSLHGFTTLVVRTSADAASARNPSVALGETGEVRAGAKLKLAPSADTDVTFSFYSTAGEMDALRATSAAPEVEWTAPAEPGPVQLWIVARDGRGGVGWLARTLQVIP